MCTSAYFDIVSYLSFVWWKLSFLDLNLSISNDTVSPKNDKLDYFDIVNFPFLDGDVPRRTSYGVYISQLFRFSRVFSHVSDFKRRNKALTAKLLKQGYRYRRHSGLVEKCKVSLKKLLQQNISELEFYCDLVYRLRKNVGLIFQNYS